MAMADISVQDRCLGFSQYNQPEAGSGQSGSYALNLMLYIKQMVK